MRFLKILLILFPPFILYIGMQTQLNEIEQWMIGVSLFLLCILFLKWRIPEIIRDIRKLKKDYPPNKQISPDFPFPTFNRLMRLAGVTILVCVVGFTILLYISSPFKF
jgi:hypothetical protein